VTPVAYAVILSLAFLTTLFGFGRLYNFLQDQSGETEEDIRRSLAPVLLIISLSAFVWPCLIAIMVIDFPTDPKDSDLEFGRVAATIPVPPARNFDPRRSDSINVLLVGRPGESAAVELNAAVPARDDLFSWAPDLVVQNYRLDRTNRRMVLESKSENRRMDPRPPRNWWREVELPSSGAMRITIDLPNSPSVQVSGDDPRPTTVRVLVGSRSTASCQLRFREGR
jgi:hypothetical protein